MRVAVAQVLTGPDPDANLQTVRAAVSEAARAGAHLVVFPEATMRAFGAGPLDEVAEELDGPWASAVAECAREHSVVVVAGMFRPAPDGRVFNTLLVTGVVPGPDGPERVHRGYDKIHLYDAFGFAESDTVAPGRETVVVDFAGVGIGLSLCYDVRFSAQYRRLALEGADVLLCCASWGAGRGKLEQWRLLTAARALDATAWVVACGQADPAAEGVEVDSAAPTGIGYSAVIAPDGQVVREAGAGQELLVVDVDPAAVGEVREAIPVLRNGTVTEAGEPDPGDRS